MYTCENRLILEQSKENNNHDPSNLLLVSYVYCICIITIKNNITVRKFKFYSL